jgi:signal transduction histidine kinase
MFAHSGHKEHHASGVAATQRRMARRALWLFLAIAVVCCAQVAWWIIFQIGETHRIGELRRAAVEMQALKQHVALSEHYGGLWWTLDSLVRADDWQGAVPRRIMDDPSLLGVHRVPPPTRKVQTPFGQVTTNVWTWSFYGMSDSLFVVLDPVYPDNYLKRAAPELEFSGPAPAQGRRSWSAYPSAVRPRSAALEAIDNQRRHTILMFASEGGFFVLLVILGAYLIYRSVRHSADLRRRQQNFIAAVTHELKAPLSSVKLYAETLERPEIEPSDRARYIERMLDDITRLEQLVDNTLMAGRLEQREFHLELKPTDLSRDVGEYVETLRGFLDRHQFQLRTDIQPDLEAVTDYEAMRRVVSSVVENAVQYSDTRREADLQLRRDDAQILLTVRDYGVGIPADDVDKVFGAFYRVGDEMTRRIKGSGLGLYLVREIVAAHGGQVRAKSEGPGRGTTITIRLPPPS